MISFLLSWIKWAAAVFFLHPCSLSAVPSLIGQLTVLSADFRLVRNSFQWPQGVLQESQQTKRQALYDRQLDGLANLIEIACKKKGDTTVAAGNKLTCASSDVHFANLYFNISHWNKIPLAAIKNSDNLRGILIWLLSFQIWNKQIVVPVRCWVYSCGCIIWRNLAMQKLSLKVLLKFLTNYRSWNLVRKELSIDVGSNAFSKTYKPNV